MRYKCEQYTALLRPRRFAVAYLSGFCALQHEIRSGFLFHRLAGCSPTYALSLRRMRFHSGISDCQIEGALAISLQCCVCDLCLPLALALQYLQQMVLM